MYTINKSYFEKIDTEHKAYWLGFIYADGYLYKEKYVRIELASKDKKHLEKFRECLSSNIPIKESIHKESIIRGQSIPESTSNVFTISRKNIVQDLIKLGMPNKNKSLSDTLPKVPEEFKRHFFRGYFDGDGCICISTKNVISAHILGRTTILKKLISNLPINQKIYKVSTTDKVKKAYWFTENDLKFLYEYMYKEATIYLDRKFEKFKQIC